MISREFCEVFKNTFLTDHLWVTAVVVVHRLHFIYDTETDLLNLNCAYCVCSLFLRGQDSKNQKIKSLYTKFSTIIKLSLVGGLVVLIKRFKNTDSDVLFKKACIPNFFYYNSIQKFQGITRCYQ